MFTSNFKILRKILNLESGTGSFFFTIIAKKYANCSRVFVQNLLFLIKKKKIPPIFILKEQ
jgi:hypothetical protein